MDVEQLKVVVELLSNLGVQGKQVFFAWLICHELIPYVVACGGIFAAYRLASAVFRSALCVPRHTRALKELRDLLHTGAPGDLSDYEINKTIKKVEALYAAERAALQARK